MKIWMKRGKLKLKQSRFFSSRMAAKRVFYPGCSLPGADPEFCLQLYEKLLEQDPGLGLWFDCCAKSFRLRKDHLVAEKAEQTLLQSLLDAGVEEVITACGNCYGQFHEFSGGRLRITMIYDLLHELELAEGSAGWTLHHPCFSRVQPQLQTSVFRLADRHGISLKNREQKEHPLACCLHKTASAAQRREKFKQGKVLTYCAHCVMSFQRDIPSRHLLQELLGSTASWNSPGRIGLFANYRRFCKLLKRMTPDR